MIYLNAKRMLSNEVRDFKALPIFLTELSVTGQRLLRSKDFFEKYFID